jgi:N utilization substance protein A
MSQEIVDAVRDIEREKGIESGTLVAALEDALLAAYKKTPGATRHASVVLDDRGDFRVFSIDIPEDIEVRLLEEARERALDELERIEEETGEKNHTLLADEDLELDWSQVPENQIQRADVTPDNFGRIAAQTAKQVILQRIREAEREMMYEEYIDRVGEVVTGIVQQTGDRRNILVDLGKVEALLPGPEQVDGERYEQGSRIKAVIREVRTGTKGPQVILSRRDPELIKTLFELEVPEIADGLVEIRGVAREPGYRSKHAVESHAPGDDPVGACLGPRGTRVRMVVSELRGEKIDIIPWNTEPARFIATALSPARVREVLVDDETKEATVIVPEDQLALAIGKEGLNARLAARLTGWKVDIQSDAEFAQAEAEAAFAGGAEGEEFSGRCSAILANGKRCPNAAVPGSRFCGIPAHRELAEREARGETLEASQVVGGVSDEEPEAEAPAEGTEVGDETVPGEPPVEEATEEAPPPEEPVQVEEPAAAEAEPEVPVEPQEAPVEPEVAVAVQDTPSEEEDEPSAA